MSNNSPVKALILLMLTAHFFTFLFFKNAFCAVYTIARAKHKANLSQLMHAYEA